MSDETLNEILDLPAIVPEEIKGELIDVTPKDDSAEEDFQEARNTIKELIEDARESLDVLMGIANQGESPRAFEVVSILLKTLLQANRDLIELRKIHNESQDLGPSSGKTVTNNNLLIATTKQINDLIKESVKKNNG